MCWPCDLHLWTEMGCNVSHRCSQLGVFSLCSVCSLRLQEVLQPVCMCCYAICSFWVVSQIFQSGDIYAFPGAGGCWPVAVQPLGTGLHHRCSWPCVASFLFRPLPDRGHATSRTHRVTGDVPSLSSLTHSLSYLYCSCMQICSVCH